MNTRLRQILLGFLPDLIGIYCSALFLLHERIQLRNEIVYLWDVKNLTGYHGNSGVDVAPPVI